MKAWWQGLEVRERRVLVLGLVAVAVMAYVLGVRLPLHDSTQDLERRVNERSELVSWMAEARSQIRELREQRPGAAAAGVEQALFSLADESAREAGFGEFLVRVEPAGDAGARLRFENIAFTDLMAWLANLRQEHGVVAHHLTVRGVSQAGRTEAILVLGWAGDP